MSEKDISTDTLESLKKDRTVARRRFNKVAKELDVFLSKKPVKSVLEDLLKDLSSKYFALRDANESLDEYAEDDTEQELIEKYMDDVVVIFAERSEQVQQYIDNQKRPELSKVKTEKTVLPNHSGLERLKVVKFTGDTREYPSWKRKFQGAMKRYGQDDDEKLQRLQEAILDRCALKRDVINCQSIDAAWKLLDKRYGDEDELVALLLKDVKNYKALRAGDHKSLRNYSSAIRTFVTRMEDLGRADEVKGLYLFTDLMSKLEPADQASYSYSMILEKRKENVTSLLDWLETQAKCRAKGQSTENSNPKPSTSRAANIASTDARTETKPKQRKCLAGCDQFHYLNDCPTFQNNDIDARRKIILEAKACFNCLKPSHPANKCFSKVRCSICQRKHHDLLHQREVTPTTDETPTEVMTESHVQLSAQKVNAILPVIKVNVIDKQGNPHQAVALIDSGSTQTLISKKFAKRLNLPGAKRELTFVVAGGDSKTEKSSYYDIEVTPVGKPEQTFAIGCYEIQQPCAAAAQVNRKHLSIQPHLKEIAQQIYCNGGNIDLLIGADLAAAHADVETRSGKSLLTAKRSVFGWTVVGKIDARKEANIAKVNSVTTVDNVDFNLLTFFEAEAIGVKPTKECLCSPTEKEEAAFLKHVKQYTSRAEDGRIQIKMPWKKGHPLLPNNRSAAENRLKQLEKRLMKDPNKMVQYNGEIESLLNLGFVKKLNKNEINDNEPAWYLPHQAVEKPERETTKMRIVFDSAAQYKGICLNDALEKGPNLTNNLLHVLLGWREDVIGITGDISKMFNQVLVHPDDQKYHRFLWRNGESNREPEVYQWVRLSFGDKPAPDLAGWAIKLLAMESEITQPEAAFVLNNRIYVDDIGHSVDTAEHAQSAIHDLDTVLGRGKFQIKSWNTNDEGTNQAKKEICDVLGHQWNLNDDTFKLKFKDSIELQNVTKRAILSCISKVWDPVGILAPFTIRHKIEMQKLWSRGLGWDEPLPNEEHESWEKLIRSLNSAVEYGIDRGLKPDDTIGLPQLHGFSDGGEEGYGCCVFLRWEKEDRSYECRFVAAKAFVAPLKRKTIPRIELMGCQTLARLVESVEKALKTELSQKILWTDSMTALKWIHSNPREFKPFVGTRIAEIQESHDPALWRYVPSEVNPSDALTRGISFGQLKGWHEGPAFLTLDVKEWPEVPSPKEEDIKDDDIQVEKKSTSTSIAATTVQEQDVVKRLLDISLFTKMRKTVAMWIRFMDNCKGPKRDVNTNPISAEELRNAEHALFRLIQVNESFENRKYEKVAPFKDEKGLWRVSGRLDESKTLPYDQRHPIILPKDHVITRRLLRSLHYRLEHPGSKRLTDEVRRKFYVIGLSDATKSINNKCVTCKKKRQKMQEQLMGSLPQERVDTFSPSFANTACDFFGPLKVKVKRNTIDKAYGCLFTCLTTRAVHVELCTDLSTDTFLMALRRFTCIRGHPNYIFSDQGTNFVGAQTYLREMIAEFKKDKITNHCAENLTDFKWEFNVPTASHRNGAVESLVKSIKNALHSITGHATYTEEQWRTFLYEAMNLVNTRPLYPSSSDVFAVPPVTPNDLLIGHNNLEAFQPSAPSKENPRELNNSVQRCVKAFWEQWIRHIPPIMMLRQKWTKERNNLDKGDLCIEKDPNLPRGLWRLALVQDVHKGLDGKVRRVTVKTATGLFERPIHKLCLIASNKDLDSP